MKLSYKNKESKNRLDRNLSPIILKAVESFGQTRLFNWHNMLILGDNLVVLKHLLKERSLYEQIKLIYIDPPFSTNQKYRSGKSRTSTVSFSHKDEIAYADQLKGPEYIEFLRKRLLFLKEILAKNGSIYVHIDYKIGHYVKAIMDEIFGIENFINDITRIKCNPKNFDRRGFGNIKDLVLFYSKTNNYIWNDSREKFTEEDIIRLFHKEEKDGRRYTTTPLHAPGETQNGRTGQIWNGMKPPKGRHWRNSPEELTKLDKKGLIEWSSTGNPRKKIYADEFNAKGKKRQDIWEFKDSQYPSYPTEKNLDMLKMIIETSSKPDDVVLDSFVGSGSTLLAAEHLGRRWIGIDDSQIAIEKAKGRLLSIEGISSFTIYETKINSKAKK